MIAKIPGGPDRNDLSAKNRRLAILLGLVSLSIYVGYIAAYYF